MKFIVILLVFAISDLINGIRYEKLNDGASTSRDSNKLTYDERREIDAYADDFLKLFITVTAAQENWNSFESSQYCAFALSRLNRKIKKFLKYGSGYPGVDQSSRLPNYARRKEYYESARELKILQNSHSGGCFRANFNETVATTTARTTRKPRESFFKWLFGTNCDKSLPGYDELRCEELR